MLLICAASLGWKVVMGKESLTRPVQLIISRLLFTFQKMRLQVIFKSMRDATAVEIKIVVPFSDQTTVNEFVNGAVRRYFHMLTFNHIQNCFVAKRY